MNAETRDQVIADLKALIADIEADRVESVICIWNTPEKIGTMFGGFLGFEILGAVDCFKNKLMQALE